MQTHDVISAFLDDEPFDPTDLATALSDAGGRQLLLDLVALRTLVRQEPIAAPASPRPVSRPAWIAVGFLAASIVFGAGAAWLLPSAFRQREIDEPPTPNRVVTVDTSVSADQAR